MSTSITVLPLSAYYCAPVTTSTSAATAAITDAIAMPPPPPRPPKYICDYCDVVFKKASTRQVHIEKHHGDTVACKDCKVVFATAESYRLHNNRGVCIAKPKTKHVCDQCGRSYTNQSNLLKHKRIKHPSMSLPLFKCIACDKGYNTEAWLERHIASKHKKKKKKQRNDDDDEKKYECSKCPKVFNTKFNLQRHEAGVHEIDKWKFKESCLYCYRYLADHCSLLRHMAICKSRPTVPTLHSHGEEEDDDH